MMTCCTSLKHPIYGVILTAVSGLLLQVFLLLLTSEPAVARQMSSKRECAICHIMWAEAFRSDQETLIPWQGGNVLMKDTQGVVSAQENCYSCHDGYVSDSRSTAWRGNNHPTMVSPSKNVSVPAQMPLSNKDQIYCGTCHTPHAGSTGPGEVPLQPSSFLRVEYTTSQLCALCHGDKADFRNSNSHPLVKMKQPIPSQLVAMGSKGGPGQRTLVCQTCHRVHGARGKKISVAEDTSAALCTTCHSRQSDVKGSKHDLRLAKGRTGDKGELKWGTCGGCHTPHDAKAKRLWKYPIQDGNAATQMCLRCHKEGGAHQAKGIGEHSHPVDTALKGIPPKGLPLYTKSGARAKNGRVQCSTCHDVHRWSPDPATPMAAVDQKGDGSNSFLRMTTSATSSLCRQCHGDKASVLTSKHNLRKVDHDKANPQSSAAERSGPCSACHLPHNAKGPRLWAWSLAPGNPATQSCLSCHANKVGKALGPNNHPKDVIVPAEISSGLPMYAPDGSVSSNGTLQCSTCHNAHVWAPGPQESAPSGPAEGDAANSFLRVDNSGSSGLCLACHKEQSVVRGTDHDLGQSAPQARNILGQRSGEAGYCSSCHVAHQSPQDMKMWAQPMGEVGPDEPPINQLCRGCHASGHSAGQRVPTVASHPRGQLITTIRSAHLSTANRMVVFDSQGQRQAVGDIACATCHDAHRRNPNGVPDNSSKKGLKFLRTMSSRSMCKECHGLDGLFRYLYFHDPKKRKGGIQP